MYILILLIKKFRFNNGYINSWPNRFKQKGVVVFCLNFCFVFGLCDGKNQNKIFMASD